MSKFFGSMFEEMGARRRRMRLAFGDRGQSLLDFLVLAGLVTGSLGLFVRDWMPAAAPWGFWLPLAFVIGHVLIELRRQAVIAAAPEPEKLTRPYDWTVLLWSFACALAGAAAFVIAMSSEPEPENWTPPESAVSVDISP